MEMMMDWLPTSPWAYVATGIAAIWIGPRAYTFIRAVISGWNKDNVAGRLAICEVCPRVKKRNHVDDTGKESNYLYCDECKCGSHHLAELNVKLGFNNLSCPMGKWGKAESMTVHEGHDLLIERRRKEAAIDKRERDNMMAGRDRDDDGPLNGTPPGPVQLGDRTAAAQAQLQPTMQAANAQRLRIEQARQEALQNARREAREAVTSAEDHLKQTNKIWGDRGKEAESATATAPSETNNAARLAGTDHEGHILVDKESGDGGHSLDERRGR